MKQRFILLIIFALLLIGCSDNTQTINDSEQKDSINVTKALYPDSLTPIQKSCVEKTHSFIFDSKHKDASYSAEDVAGYMTNNEIDAIVELSIWDFWKKYKVVDNATFFRRFKDVFGYEFDVFSKFLQINDDLPNSIKGKNTPII